MPQFESEYEEKLYNDRLASLEKIRAVGERLGLSPAEAAYPNSFAFTATVPELRAMGEAKSGEELEAEPIEAAIAGRVVTIRGGFAVLQQGGERMQIYVHKDAVGPDLMEMYKALHLGDHIGVRGRLMRTKTGELTLKAMPVEGKQALVFLVKAMLSLPDKYHGLEDVEQRYRQRYVDLIMNQGPAQGSGSRAQGPEGAAEADEAVRDVRAVFVKRAAVLRAVRRFFDERGFIEVETPMLHTVAGGATARTFSTHHNAEDMTLTLRIAPELHLKRLVVGGLDRVYEINRNFRNEGVDRTHNPEFTMLEFYQAYANYHDLMALTEELIKFVAMEVNGTTVTQFNGVEIDLGKWTKLSMREAIVKFWPEEADPAPKIENFSSRLALLPAVHRLHRYIENLARPLAQLNDNEPDNTPHEELPAVLQQRRHLIKLATTVFNLGIELEQGSVPLGRTIASIFELLGEDLGANLVQPTIVYDFPLAVSPLSKVKPDEPEWVERFEFYIGGFEVGNAFSELNDAADQERRFEAQLAEKARGDEEAMEMDEDYVRALGYGLPPTAGEGIGIDRLTMLLTGSRSIRDVILFPLMRAKGKAGGSGDVVGGESAE